MINFTQDDPLLFKNESEDTSPKTNISTENKWLEDENSFFYTVPFFGGVW